MHGGPRVARVGGIAMRAQPEVPSALRTDTPMLVALADVTSAPNDSTRTCVGEADRSA
jgi:hypothetical protein